MLPQNQPKDEGDARLGSLVRRTATGWELWAALIAAAVVATLGDENGLREVAGAVGSAQSQMGVAIAGVVLAALAIFIVFLDDEYVELLERHTPGVAADLEPFQHTIVVATLTAVAGVGLVAIGKPTDTFVLRLLFGISTFFFLYLLLITCQLVWVLTRYMKLRVRQLQMKNFRKQQSEEGRGK